MSLTLLRIDLSVSFLRYHIRFSIRLHVTIQNTLEHRWRNSWFLFPPTLTNRQYDGCRWRRRTCLPFRNTWCHYRFLWEFVYCPSFSFNCFCFVLFLYVSLWWLSHLIIASGGNAECLINMNLGKFVKYFPFIIPAILQFILANNFRSCL